MIVLYVLAVVGLFVLPRSFVVLAVILLGYQTLVAMLFAGATRYRVPWDFLVAILAAAGWARSRASLGTPPLRRGERALVELLDALDAALRRELRQCSSAPALPSRRRGEVARERDDRVREGVGVSRWNDDPGLTVGDDLRKPAHRARDDGPRALHRLERDHAEPLAERGHDDDRGVLDRLLHRRDEAEEANGVVEPELARRTP